MDKNELVNKLIQADKELQDLFDGITIDIYIVGGSALVLNDYIARGTIDIDNFSNPPREVLSVLEKYDINCRVSAYMFSFPYNCMDRLSKKEINTKVLQVYTLSLEDLVLSKLCSHRKKDFEDINSKQIVSSLNWELLDKIVQDNEMDNGMSEREYKEFLNNYKNYVGKNKK